MYTDNFFIKTNIETPKIQGHMIETGQILHIDEDGILISLSVSPEEIMPKSTMDALKDCGLKPNRFRAFKWNVNRSTAWHRDGTPDKMLNFSLTWVLSGGGEVQWNRDIILEETHLAQYGSRKSTSSDTFEAQTFGHQNLVNTTIPHRVITGPEKRVSLGLMWDNYAHIYTYDDAVSRLSSVGLISNNY